MTQLFSTYGRVCSLRLVRDVFSVNCRGFGFIEIERYETHTAISVLNGLPQQQNQG
ncbi:MAG: hypothetical protein CSA09_01550 [Candidatus Contendobacter odensis]|uniref:RRM domain-containing protein n=1 Tax=Candidatus Contendibacter odensensis TaxID=1400860 RepID=A0A2G6PHB3_9GAMM|nr:MAG: hypothetical protein CSA09_01550 [Candidatus Contendobacter odensis]